MSGRTVATKLLLKDQPELPKEAQLQLEMDKLFFLDRESRGRMSFTRPLVPGEELPYRLDLSAEVRVLPHRRELSVFGIQTLIIEEPVEAKTKPREHASFGVDNIRAMYTAIREEAEKRRPRAAKPSVEERAAQARVDRERQVAARKEKQEKRDGIRSAKRIETLKKKAQRLQGRDGPIGQLAETVLENIPAITFHGNGA